MAKFPALPLWTDAYLADCAHLTDAEHGRYLMILMMLWRAPRQRVPNDDEWLARRFRRSVEDVQREIRPLLDEFCRCDGNWITQPRLSREFEYVDSQRKKQSDRAKSRYKNQNDDSRGPATPGNAPTPTPTPTPNEDSAPDGQDELFPEDTAEHESPDLFAQWWSIYPRKESRKKATEKFKTALKQVSFDDLMVATKNYAEAMKAKGTEQQFIAHPSTWLYQERWEDWLHPQQQQGGEETEASKILRSMGYTVN